MALITTVAKKSVQYRMPKLWNITPNLTMLDGEVEVINKDYSVRYRTGDSIPAKTDEFTSMMQADIDKYKSEQTIYNAAALNTVVMNVGNALEV